MFKTTTFNNRQNDEIQLNTHINQFMIRMDKNKYSTVEEFKNWLKEKYNNGNPVYVDYILAEPKLIECTPEQVEILKQIANDKNYEGLTYIYSTDKVAPQLKATYSKDLKAIINRINDAIVAEGSI